MHPDTFNCQVICLITLGVYGGNNYYTMCNMCAARVFELSDLMNNNCKTIYL